MSLIIYVGRDSYLFSFIWKMFNVNTGVLESKLSSTHNTGTLQNRITSAST